MDDTERPADTNELAHNVEHHVQSTRHRNGFVYVALGAMLAALVVFGWRTNDKLDNSQAEVDALRAQVLFCTQPENASSAYCEKPVSGPAGAPGEEGSPGPAGPSGAPGLTGSPGPTGKRGPRGFTGLDGTTGPRGPAGAAGPTGAAGDDGPRGEQGPAGPQGEQGPRGEQGPPGEPGSPGEQGSPGPACPSGYSPQTETVITAEHPAGVTSQLCVAS